jgi:DNA-binding PadR family transcriptional regulator
VVEEGVREVSAVDEAERLAWLVLQTVNQMQARNSTVRLVIPRDPEVANELGCQLGVGPSDEDLLSAEAHLLEHGYVTPVDLGLTKGTYTITPAGKGWLERGLVEPPASHHEELPEVEQELSAGSSPVEDAHGDLRRRLEFSELAQSRLKEERDLLVRELEKERDERMNLEEELAQARRSWWRGVFGR